MKNGARYVVTTRWGTFSLDEGAYQDYLSGNLWICWDPGKSRLQKRETAGHLPPDVTDRAMALRDQADKMGILPTLGRMGLHEALVPYCSRLDDLSIDEMNLTVRSSNGLKRAGIHTFGRLKEVLAIEDGLLKIRNIGRKSVREIRQMFFEECYGRLLPYEKACYWQEVLDT